MIDLLGRDQELTPVNQVVATTEAKIANLTFDNVTTAAVSLAAGAEGSSEEALDFSDTSCPTDVLSKFGVLVASSAGNEGTISASSALALAFSEIAFMTLM